MEILPTLFPLCLRLTTSLMTLTLSLVKTSLNIMFIIKMLIFFRYLRGREA